MNKPTDYADGKWGPRTSNPDGFVAEASDDTGAWTWWAKGKSGRAVSYQAAKEAVEAVCKLGI